MDAETARFQIPVNNHFNDKKLGWITWDILEKYGKNCGKHTGF